MCGLTVLVGTVDNKVKIFLKEKDYLKHRGPDSTDIYENKNVFMLFNRLAIMDLSSKGNQPFVHENLSAVCNGEIYNYKEIKSKYEFDYKSESDCEVLIPLFLKHKEKLVDYIDGEYACVIMDSEEDEVFAARDEMGIRPLFYGVQRSNGDIAFSSEVKTLQDICHDIQAFPPGHYYYKGQFVKYKDLAETEKEEKSLHKIYAGIRTKLTNAVRKRLNADAPVGFLLSGGLDSSLVCALAARISNKPIVTFATGIKEDPIDTKYARIVADYIGSDHHEVLFSKEDVLRVLDKVIYHLETWDITTIRASIGMYLVCEYIKEKTNIKVLLTGEVSDELFGYKYTDFAPSPEEFQKESQKRVRELYMYDVLRADRCIAANSLEARVPFSDKDFVQFVMEIDPLLKMKKQGLMGKFLLRQAFELASLNEEGEQVVKPLLPEEILWREKAAFSDAVGHSMVNYLKEHAEKEISDYDFHQSLEAMKEEHGVPFTKEALLYRRIFEKHYPNKSYLIKDFWMPNKSWPGCDVKDPSARVLKNYGKSGE